MPIYNFKPRNIIAPKIESMQDTYESSTSNPPLPPLPPTSPPPPTPPVPCLLDIVIGIDISSSLIILSAGLVEGVNEFVETFVDGLDHLMDGSINGVPGSSVAQVGVFTYTQAPGGGNCPNGGLGNNVSVQTMTDSSSTIKSYATLPQPFVTPSEVLGVGVGGGDSFDQAIGMGMTMLNDFGSSALGNRSSQPNYKRIMIIVSDNQSDFNCDGSGQGGPSSTNPWGVPCFTTDMSTDVWNVGSLAGSPELDVEVYGYHVHATNFPVPNWLSKIECIINPAHLPGHSAHGNGIALGALGTTLANTLCLGPPPTYVCSGASGVGHPGGTPWDCYNPGTGLGTSWGACQAACTPSNVSDCLLDIVIAVDVSGSAGLPGQVPGTWFGQPGHPYEAERILLENLIDYLTPGMITGEIQVGVVFWASYGYSLDPDGFSMSSNHLGDLNTSKILQDPNGDWHSPIAKRMYDHATGSNPGNPGGGTNITGAMNRVFRPSGGTLTPGVLNRKSTSDFATQYPARANDPDFTQVGIIITDSRAPLASSGLPVTSATSPGCVYQSDSLTPSPHTISGPTNQFAIGCVAVADNTVVSSLDAWNNIGSAQQNNIHDTLDAITCMQNTGTDPWNTSTTVGSYGFFVNSNDPAMMANVGAAILSQACFPSVPATFNCTGASGSPFNPPLPWVCYNPGTGSGQFQGPNAWSDCLANCANPTLESWRCSGPFGVSLLSGQLIQPWTCYDPGNGTGQYPSQGLCQADCYEPAESYNCHIWPPTALVGTCSDPLDGSGHYSVANSYLNPYQDCIDACKNEPVIEDPVLGFYGDPCKPILDTPVNGLYYWEPGYTGQWTASSNHNFPYPDTCVSLCCDTLSCPCGWEAIYAPSWLWEWKCEKTLNGITKTRSPYNIFCHHINGLKPHTNDVWLINDACDSNWQSNPQETFGATTITWDSAFVICPMRDAYADHPQATYHNLSLGDIQNMMLGLSPAGGPMGNFFCNTVSSTCKDIPPITLPVGIDHG